MLPMSGLSRRQLLGGGALLGAAWLSVHVLGHRSMGQLDSPFLGEARHTLDAVFEVLLPPEADQRSLAAGVDRFMADSNPVTAEQFRMALLVLEHAGGASPVRTTRFSRRSVEERRAILERWRTSRIGVKRQIYQGMHKVTFFTWYSHPDSFASTGYDREFPS